MTSVADLESRLASESEKLERLEDAAQTARKRSSAATPGGLVGAFDHGVLTRPRSSRRAESRRHAAYDQEAAAASALRDQQQVVQGVQRQLERARADAKAPRDLEALKPGDYIRDRWGWHKVVRVNKKTVSVETGYSWTEGIANEKIIETRPANPSQGGGDARG